MYQIASASLRATSIRATLGAALAPEALLGGLVVRRVGGVAGRVHRRLDQRPAPVGGAVLGEGAAAVALAQPPGS